MGEIGKRQRKREVVEMRTGVGDSLTNLCFYRDLYILLICELKLKGFSVPFFFNEFGRYCPESRRET